jgi:hypothetical protein
VTCIVNSLSLGVAIQRSVVTPFSHHIISRSQISFFDVTGDKTSALLKSEYIMHVVLLKFVITVYLAKLLKFVSQ